MGKLRPTKEEWFQEVEKYKLVVNKLGRYIGSQELTKNQWGLHSANWYIINSQIKNIKTYVDFVTWCGFKIKYKASKDEVIKKIYEMQSKLSRPLCIDDFKNKGRRSDDIGIRIIWKYWSSFHEMQAELGLVITGQFAYKCVMENIKNGLIKICNEVYNQDQRKIITSMSQKHVEGY